MPYRDGTGPFGLGHGTGRGRGGCRTSSFLGVRRIGFFSSLIPVAAAVLRDMANPDGLLRSFGRTLIAKKTDSAKLLDASFTVLNETDSKIWSTNRKGKEM